MLIVGKAFKKTPADIVTQLVIFTKALWKTIHSLKIKMHMTSILNLHKKCKRREKVKPAARSRKKNIKETG